MNSGNARLIMGRVNHPQCNKYRLLARAFVCLGVLSSSALAYAQEEPETPEQIDDQNASTNPADDVPSSVSETEQGAKESPSVEPDPSEKAPPSPDEQGPTPTETKDRAEDNKNLEANPNVGFSEEVSDDTFMDLSLTDLLKMDVTSATKKTQKISQAPAVISVITAKQIQERGYRTVGEALESVAGLDLLHDHFQYNLGIRGISGGKRAWSRIVKVMIDGQPVSFRSSSENWLGEELIPMNVISKIEIIRGPGSALYGANAFLGVINIITKTAEEVRIGEVLGQFGVGEDYLAGGANVMAGGNAGDFDVVVAGSFFIPNDTGYKVVPMPGEQLPPSIADEESRDDIAAKESYFAKLHYGNERMGDVTLDFNLQWLDSYAEFQDWGYLTHNNRVGLYNLYGRAKYGKSFGETLDWDISFAFSNGETSKKDRLDIDNDDAVWTSRDLGFMGFDAATQGTYNFDEWTSLSLGIDFNLDKHNLLSYYQEPNHDRNPPLDQETGEKEFLNLGAYLQAVVYPFRLAKKEVDLGVTAGFRFDYHNEYDNAFNYRAGIVYPIADWIYVKALWGTSFKAPSATQLYSNYIVNRGIIGNKHLKPEKANTVEAAVGARIGKYVSLTLNGFYNIIKDKVFFPRS